MKSLAWIALTALCFTACSRADEDILRSSNLGGEVITGFQYTDALGTLLNTVGNPNNKTSETTSQYSYRSFVYPIPARYSISVSVFGIQNSQVVNAWIVTAKVDNRLYQQKMIGNASAIVVQGTPLLQQQVTGQDLLSFDISSLPEGAYRLYVKIDDVLLWDNILVTENY